MTPVTSKRGDLYVSGWLIDWWRGARPSHSVDDLVEYVTQDYCSDFRIFGDSCVRFVRDS